MSEAVDRETAELRSVDLGEISPARSRHAGRRSAVALTSKSIFVGTADGDVVAYDRPSLDTRWRATTPEEMTSAVALATIDDAVVVGERSPRGAVRCYDRETGERRWQYTTAADVGEPQKETRFFLPYVADVQVREERIYVAARRYERDGERRSFRSAIYAFEGSGAVTWSYETDASPIALDVGDDRLAVAYNRCPGDHQNGLVVLDTVTGDVRELWDPGNDGQRRVGDVSLVPDGVVVASHGDYRGYCIDDDGSERWAVDLATLTDVDGETLYAYPNHVHATADGVVFVTGNTYSTADGRETDSLHPAEHTAFGYTLDGKRRWTASVGGFAGEIATDGRRVAVPGAQHFRTRDADVHGLQSFEIATGDSDGFLTDGIVTAAAMEGETVVAIEEPVVYHDEGMERGGYRVLVDNAKR